MWSCELRILFLNEIYGRGIHFHPNKRQRNTLMRFTWAYKS